MAVSDLAFYHTLSMVETVRLPPIWGDTPSSVNLRVSTGQPANLAPSVAFCAPANWRTTRQPTCFYWHERAPTAHSPANLAADWNACFTCAAKYVRSSPNACNTRLPVSGTSLETVRCQPHQKVVDERQRITSHRRQPNCFYKVVSWYFAAVSQYHPTYAGNHCSLETCRTTFWCGWWRTVLMWRPSRNNSGWSESPIVQVF